MQEKLSEMILRCDPASPSSAAEIRDCYSNQVREILTWLEKARTSQVAETYGALKSRIDALRDDLRESAQAVTRREIVVIIGKLSSGAELSADDHTLIRHWMVGDADAYLEEENNLEDWLRELDRLEGEIRNLEAGPVEIRNLRRLQALLADARGVIPNVASYLEYRDRIERFEASIQEGLDEGRRAVLAGLLQASLESPLR